MCGGDSSRRVSAWSSHLSARPMRTLTRNVSCGRSKKNVWTGWFRSGEQHFRRAVAEYVAHYHGERNHQGLGNRLISGPPVIRITSRVRRHPRLGGLLNFYERAA